VNGTFKPIYRVSFARPCSTRQPFSAPGKQIVGDFGGVISSRRCCPLPRNEAMVVFPPVCRSASHPDFPLAPVAYPVLARSRLGYSPNWGFDAAYHTTSCKYRRYTNQFRGKNTGGLPASRPPAPLPSTCSPVTLAAFPDLDSGVRHFLGGPENSGFHDCSNPYKD